MKLLLILGNLLIFPWFSYSQINTINTIAGIKNAPGYSGDGGAASSAHLTNPFGMCTDNTGNLYIADIGNHVIRKIDRNGIITTVAGNGTAGYSGDGGPATSARFYTPRDVAVDMAGNLYISDFSKRVVRKVNTAGIISTIAGNGTQGYTGDGGPATAAQLYHPAGLAIDHSGNLYIADDSNHVVRKVNTAGIISTFAGNGYPWYSGDGGPATSATMWLPSGIAVDNMDNVYITDRATSSVRKVNRSGIISTFAGNGSIGYSGDGGPATAARIHAVFAIAFDNSNNAYITDNDNAVIRKIDAAGIITTFAGTPKQQGYSGDGGPALSAKLWYPVGIAADATGIYVTDPQNQTIRKISPCIASVPSLTISSTSDNICAGTPVTFNTTALNEGATPEYQWQLNGVNTGTNSPKYTNKTLVNGDKVSCILTSSLACTAPVSSDNVITMTVHPLPGLTISPDTIIWLGGQAQLHASATGTIVEYRWTPSAGLSNTTIPNPVATPAKTTTYQLTVVTDKGCTANAGMTVYASRKIVLPNAFTPNRDGKNDVFKIPEGIYFTLQNFSIYNRWGNLIFSTTDINKGWDGTYKGFNADIGTYVYVINGSFINSKVFLKGTVELMR
jgi:gliding motility-associated-like protein